MATDPELAATAVVGAVVEAMDRHGILIGVDGVTDDAEMFDRVMRMWSDALTEVAELLDPNEVFDFEVDGV